MNNSPGSPAFPRTGDDYTPTAIHKIFNDHILHTHADRCPRRTRTSKTTTTLT